MRYFVLVNDYGDILTPPTRAEFTKTQNVSEEDKWYELVEVNQETLEREEQ